MTEQGHAEQQGRGIPDANEAVHRLDAADAAFMAAHASGITEAWFKNGDPTRYAGWNEEQVRRHWPAFWTRWRNVVQAQALLTSLLNNEMRRRQ